MSNKIIDYLDRILKNDYEFSHTSLSDGRHTIRLEFADLRIAFEATAVFNRDFRELYTALRRLRSNGEYTLGYQNTISNKIRKIDFVFIDNNSYF